VHTILYFKTAVSELHFIHLDEDWFLLLWPCIYLKLSWKTQLKNLCHYKCSQFILKHTEDTTQIWHKQGIKKHYFNFYLYYLSILILYSLNLHFLIMKKGLFFYHNDLIMTGLPLVSKEFKEGLLSRIYCKLCLGIWFCCQISRNFE